MVPESWVKESRRRTPTGMGVVIDVEGEMKKIGVSKPIDRIRFTISPVQVGERRMFKVHRRASFSNGKAGGGNEGPFGSLADARSSCRTWLHLNVTTAKRPPAKWEQVTADGYYRGGREGETLRKVIMVAGDMVHWCDRFGLGACGLNAFAAWMKKKVDAPDDPDVRRIQQAIDDSGISKTGMRFAASMLGLPVNPEREIDEDQAPPRPSV